MPAAGKTIYLTFDDGPTPNVTEWVLEQLSTFDAKATFFCIGKNVEKHPGIFEKVKQQGHSIGNHTYQHLNGWQTSTIDYLGDIEKCASVFPATLFRPPYGKITRKQVNNLLNQPSLVKGETDSPTPSKIVMWDVLSWDFETNVSHEKCLQNVLKNTTSGSIVVFHDSVKALKNMEFALPKVLEQFSEKGYRFEGL